MGSRIKTKILEHPGINQELGTKKSRLNNRDSTYVKKATQRLNYCYCCFDES